VSILSQCPGEGYKLCKKKLHWYLPAGNGRGCAECRREYARMKYHTDPVFREKRIQGAIRYERNNQELCNERKRNRYHKDVEFRERRRQQINAQKRNRWEKDKAWRAKKLKQTARWFKQHPHKRLAYDKLKQAKRKQRFVEWANQSKIEAFYQEAKRLSRQTGVEHHVDHIYPMISCFMCGLHVEGNLQILTAAENCSKGNRTWPGQLDCQKQPVSVIFPKELTDLLND
jgi:hypothetical protein